MDLSTSTLPQLAVVLGLACLVVGFASLTTRSAMIRPLGYIFLFVGCVAILVAGVAFVSGI